MDILSLFKIGETVLVEYSGTSRVEALFYNLIARAGLPVLVDDIFDTYYEFYVRLKVAGFDVTPLEDAMVVKMGGSRRIGNVVGELNISKYVISEQEYATIIEKIKKDKPFLNLVLGIHKLIILGSILENMNVVKMVSSYVGRKERVAFYFINKGVVNKHSPPILDLLEEVATSVLEVTERGVIIKKAINKEIIGEVIPL
ncbi:DUF257 family protein [Pyrococcus abyssi]|uniref:KaiC-like domain-containing protein n=1 Tax=Pyrococcus abyssi (strain GE5 / Orsay) TaxID=272844 RepID=Q9V244_PYRAB|nr:DUF257 family protein [Pyrococcus abyssi]CAB49154.1 Hypothetical protein PAB0156 [Pyrococcus abyssi GE5]CCE69606.1 TPA: hypothetical protein PAB0156 [Pyrococcus abyssi GE5]